MKHSSARRFFLKSLALGTVALLVAPLVKIQTAFSDPVKTDDPLVKALGYVDDAKKSKDWQDKKDKKALCGNCQFYQGDAKSKTGKCQLIPTGEVAAAGWCRSYSVKQKKA